MQHQNTRYQQHAAKPWGALRFLLMYAVLLPLFGCNSFGNGKLVQQLQGENERLLTEFRAERQRREDSERLNATLEARLSESEKLLARQTQGTIPERLSRLQQNLGKPVGAVPAIRSNGSGLDSKDSSNADFSTSAESEFRWQRRVN